MQPLVEAVQHILIEGVVDSHFTKVGFDQNKAKELAKRWTSIPNQYKGGINVLGTKTTQEVENLFKRLEAEWSESKTGKEKAVKRQGVQGLVHGKDYIEIETGIDNVAAYAPLTHHASQLIASTRIGACEGEWCISSNNPRDWKTYTEDRDSAFAFVVDYSKEVKYSYEFTNTGKVNVFNRYDEVVPEPYRGLAKKLKPSIDKIREKYQPWKSDYSNGIRVRGEFKNHDGTIDCDSISISADANITSLADIGVVFNSVRGSVVIKNDKIKSLKGSPRYVNASFICTSKSLTSLEGAPIKVGRAFDIDAPITSLSDVPEAGDLSFKNAKFTNLVGLPEMISSLSVTHTPLTSLKGCPKTIDGMTEIGNTNITNMIGGPEVVHGSFYCTNNSSLTSLEGCPRAVVGTFDVSNNKISDLDHLPMAMLSLAIGGNKALLSKYTRDEITKMVTSVRKIYF